MNEENIIRKLNELDKESRRLSCLDHSCYDCPFNYEKINRCILILIEEWKEEREQKKENHKEPVRKWTYCLHCYRLIPENKIKRHLIKKHKLRIEE